MIKIGYTAVPFPGFIAAIIGLRHSYKTHPDTDFNNIKDGRLMIGPNDMALMKRIAKIGGSEAKFRRMIVVYADITAPIYWWKQMDTYAVGKVQQSESTMHTLCNEKIKIDDFSTEDLDNEKLGLTSLKYMIDSLNILRTKKKHKAMIQLLPESYNQARMLMLNYEVLAKIYQERKNHKLQEWHDLIKWMETLPLSKEFIFCEE